MADSVSTRNPYLVLGLHKGASEEEIKHAYVTLVKKYDPEIHTDRFMVIQSAFERLEDPEKRASQDIKTFNHVQGEFSFAKEEMVNVPDAKLNQAIQLLEQKNQAEPQNVAQIQPKLIQGYLLRAWKNLQKKLLKEAIDDWHRVIAIDPTHRRAKNNLLCAFMRLGYSYANHGLHEEGIELWEKAAQMDPDNHRIIHNLALACEEAGRIVDAQRYWDETLKRWNLFLERNPEDEYLKNCIVEARRHISERGEEMPAAAGAPQPTPSGATASNAPTASTSNSTRTAPAPSAPAQPKDKEAAIAQWREILKLKPEDFDANFKLAQLLMEEKKWPEAAAHLTELHQKFPKNIEVINMLGWSQLNSQEVDMAFRTWRRGLKIDPKNFSVREALIKANLSIGRALREKNLFINALVRFKDLARYMKGSEDVHYELGLTYQMQGDYRSALREFKKVMEMNPRHKEAKARMSELKMRRA